jgi:hypothetical protein
MKVRIGDKEFTFATSWEDIYFGQYVDLINIVQSDEIQLQKSLRILAALSDNEEECYNYLLKIDRTSFEKLEQHFLWIDSDYKYLKSLPTKSEFEVEGRIFKKINNPAQQITLADQINVETLIENCPNLTNFEVAFGVLIKEYDKDGNEVEFTEQQFIEILTFLKPRVLLKDVYSTLAFFLPGEEELTNSSTHFSVEILQEQPKE